MKKQSRYLYLVIIAAIWIIGSLFFVSENVNAKVKSGRAKVKFSAQNKVKISWTKQKKVKKVTVERAIIKKGTKKVKFKKIKVYKKNVSSFSDKKLKNNTLYAYRVKCFSKKGKLLYTAETELYTGMPEISWAYETWWLDEDNLQNNNNGTPTLSMLVGEKIYGDDWDNLLGGWEINFPHTGYEIQRKDLTKGETKFKTVKKIKASQVRHFNEKEDDEKYSFEAPCEVCLWQDSTSKLHHHYEYRVRSYGKIGRKKINSKWSPVARADFERAWWAGSLELLDYDNQSGQVLILVQNDIMCSTVIMNNSIKWDAGYIGTIVGIKREAGEWKDNKEPISVEPGEGVQITCQLEPVSTTGADEFPETLIGASFVWQRSYNGDKRDLHKLFVESKRDGGTVIEVTVNEYLEEEAGSDEDDYDYEEEDD